MPFTLPLHGSLCSSLHTNANLWLQMTLRPAKCPSPTTLHRPMPHSCDQNVKQQAQLSITAAGITSCLSNQPSSATAADCLAGWPSHPGLYSSNSFGGTLRAEPSSCSVMLAAEASKSSTVGAAALDDGNEGPRRRDALSAARRMVLERQVRLAW